MDDHNLEDKLNKMMQSAAMMSALQSITAAYDGYATQAMVALITAWPHKEENVVAEVAWRYADAMMDERKKRGIGAMPTEPAGVPMSNDDIARFARTCELCSKTLQECRCPA